MFVDPNEAKCSDRKCGKDIDHLDSLGWYVVCWVIMLWAFLLKCWNRCMDLKKTSWTRGEGLSKRKMSSFLEIPLLSIRSVQQHFIEGEALGAWKMILLNLQHNPRKLQFFNLGFVPMHCSCKQSWQIFAEAVQYLNSVYVRLHRMHMIQLNKTLVSMLNLIFQIETLWILPYLCLFGYASIPRAYANLAELLRSSFMYMQ